MVLRFIRPCVNHRQLSLHAIFLSSRLVFGFFILLIVI